MSTTAKDVNTNAIPVEALKDILATVLIEARKPVVTEDEARAKVQAAQDRKEMALTLEQQRINKKNFQKICNHMNDNTCVYVQVALNGGSYLYCQHCEDKVFPDKDPVKFSHYVQMKGVAING